MYVSLHTHSYYSLLRGASSTEALVEQAARYQMPAMALTDNDALYGAVAFSEAAKTAGIKPIFGTELTLTNGGQLILLAETNQGYRNLCRIVSLARRGQDKGTAAIAWQEVAKYARGLIALSGGANGEIGRALLDHHLDRAVDISRRYASIFGPDHFFLEIQRHHEYMDLRVNDGLQQLAAQTHLRLVATTDVRYIERRQAELLDVMTAIRHNLPLEQAEPFLLSNDEFYLPSPEEMFERFVDLPDAVQATRDIAGRCNASVTRGPQQFPVPTLPPGYQPFQFLTALCREGFKRKVPSAKQDVYKATLQRELDIIKKQNLTAYFLVVWDVVQFARENKILCQGRGSAANSLVSYLLDITPVDPIGAGLVFERFLSPERLTPADIDVDFASNRREEVIQYIYEKYGRDNVALSCNFNTFGARSALTDVGKALGFSKELIAAIKRENDSHSAADLIKSPRLREAFGKHVDTPLWKQLFTYASELDSYPRHLSIHVGGMVIAINPSLIEQIPIEPATMENRFVTQGDKDVLERMGLVKLDILSLRTLSAIEDALMFIEQRTGKQPDLSSLSLDDPRVFAMLRRRELIGVFQCESSAQENLQWEFGTRSFADLVIQIALIRPGPMQANMVRPYLDRRKGRRPVTYLHPLLKNALEETLGVILFQEQVLKITRDVAGFTAGEGELLRRALGNKRASEKIEKFHDTFIAGAQANGVPLPIAEKIFDQLRAFGGYSFSKAHAAAFAVISYWSAWLRCYYPSEFFGGILRYQPMGFYDARVVVSDAERKGIRVIPLDARTSQPQTIVKNKVIHIGLDYIDGWGEEQTEAFCVERLRRPCTDLNDLVKRSRLPRKHVESLILSGGLEYMGEQRDLLWKLAEAFHLAKRPHNLIPLPLERTASEMPVLAPMTAKEKLMHQFHATGITVGQHLTAAKDDVFRKAGALTVKEALQRRNGQAVRMGGVVAIAQKPPTAVGRCYLMVEDAGGMLNIMIEPEVYEKYRREVRGFVVVEGILKRPTDEGPYLLASKIQSV
jgi:error-prone DNA polymerase